MNWIAIYPEILLLVLACVVMLVDLFVKDAQHRVSYWLTLLGLVGIGVLCGLYYASGMQQFAMARALNARYPGDRQKMARQSLRQPFANGRKVR